MNPSGCTHIPDDAQYASFIAPTKTQYNKQRANREVETIRQGMIFDGEPHRCYDIPGSGRYDFGPKVYVVALKPEGETGLLM